LRLYHLRTKGFTQHLPAYPRGLAARINGPKNLPAEFNTLREGAGFIRLQDT